MQFSVPEKESTMLGIEPSFWKSSSSCSRRCGGLSGMIAILLGARPACARRALRRRYSSAALNLDEKMHSCGTNRTSRI
jgi:hypothetical protein